MKSWAAGSDKFIDFVSINIGISFYDFPAFRLKQKNELQEIICFLKFIFLTGFKSFIF
ncbi:hypothetical protein IV64_GL001386 [Lactiplantibacillus xiangfangensis]|uniref:Uncharacterized protein n=1 Tax=Lactiplantibacillus xiangfangensis TaxID=942150 RepID=A0A0R2M0P6_9LACO|nr:hypothetical protein IV64_GL001386 [Lactiplantibacillus xiangfangensis]